MCVVVINIAWQFFPGWHALLEELEERIPGVNFEDLCFGICAFDFGHFLWNWNLPIYRFCRITEAEIFRNTCYSGKYQYLENFVINILTSSVHLYFGYLCIILELFAKKQEIGFEAVSLCFVFLSLNKTDSLKDAIKYEDLKYPEVSLFTFSHICGITLLVCQWISNDR